MHYMKDVFNNVDSDHAHEKFIRYSKGVFTGPLLKVKFSKANIKVSGSFHFVDELLIIIAKAIGDKYVMVKGSLIWNEDLSSKLEDLGIKYSKVSKSRGIFKYQLENEINIKDFVESMNSYHILVNIKEEDVSFTTKSSFPKPNKEFSNDFCKVVLPTSFEKMIKEEFLFDVKNKDFKDALVHHKIFVDDILLPENAPNFDVARKEAKRVGKIERTVTLSGSEEIKSEIEIKV